MTDTGKHKNHESGGLRAEKRSSSSSDTAGGITRDTDRRKHDPAIQQVELEMQIIELQNALTELHNTKQRLEKLVQKKTVNLRQINEQLRRSQNELKLFAKNTIERLERERRKVSDELHDTVAQGLATIKLLLENKLALLATDEISSSFLSRCHRRQNKIFGPDSTRRFWPPPQADRARRRFMLPVCWRQR